MHRPRVYRAWNTIADYVGYSDGTHVVHPGEGSAFSLRRARVSPAMCLLSVCLSVCPNSCQ